LSTLSKPTGTGPDLWSFNGHPAGSAQIREHLTELERHVLRKWTGKLVLAISPTSDWPAGHRSIGDLVIWVHSPASSAAGRWITIGEAEPLVVFSWRLLREATRADSVVPWVKLDKACSCAPGTSCRHYRGAKLEILARDRTVTYILVHDVPSDSSRVVSDAIAGRWPVSPASDRIQCS
jgi:hypothetical protein